MTAKELAEIKALAIKTAHDLHPTPELDRLLIDAQIIYEFLIKT